MTLSKKLNAVWISSLLALSAHGAQVNLQWDAPQANIDGSAFTNLECYIVYCGARPGVYDFGVEVDTTRAAITGLQAGVTYYFAVEACNTWRLHSERSQEIQAVAANATPPGDADVDGMPDAWEREHFGNNTADAEADADGDDFSNLEEYIAGTDPNDPDSGPFIDMFVYRKYMTLTFDALAASEGTRYYTLETSYSLSNPVWRPVPGYEAIVGRNQLVSYQERSRIKRYYRLNIWLE